MEDFSLLPVDPHHFHKLTLKIFKADEYIINCNNTQIWEGGKKSENSDLVFGEDIIGDKIQSFIKMIFDNKLEFVLVRLNSVVLGIANMEGLNEVYVLDTDPVYLVNDEEQLNYSSCEILLLKCESEVTKFLKDFISLIVTKEDKKMKEKLEATSYYAPEQLIDQISTFCLEYTTVVFTPFKEAIAVPPSHEKCSKAVDVLEQRLYESQVDHDITKAGSKRLMTVQDELRLQISKMETTLEERNDTILHKFNECQNLKAKVKELKTELDKLKLAKDHNVQSMTQDMDTQMTESDSFAHSASSSRVTNCMDMSSIDSAVRKIGTDRVDEITAGHDVDKELPRNPEMEIDEPIATVKVYQQRSKSPDIVEVSVKKSVTRGKAASPQPSTSRAITTAVTKNTGSRKKVKSEPPEPSEPVEPLKRKRMNPRELQKWNAKKQAKIDKKKEKITKYPCRICRRQRDGTDLKRHYFIHHSIEFVAQYVCGCNKFFSSWDDMRVHRRGGKKTKGGKKTGPCPYEIPKSTERVQERYDAAVIPDLPTLKDDEEEAEDEEHEEEDEEDKDDEDDED